MPLTVSTSCPSCGGSLEFEHGTNAVKCGFCGSSHVVTGHGRVLSYYIPEKIDVKKAVALALVALRDKGIPDCKVKDATLFFVPFYHFIGRELSWGIKEKVIGEGGELQVHRTTVVTSISIGDGEFGKNFSEFHKSSQEIIDKRFEMSARHIDRTLSAANLPELGVFSLGFRPEILKLSLFERKAVLARGQITPVKLPLAEVEERGFAPVKPEDTVSRRVFGKTKSIIYFPFWIIEVSKPDGSGCVAVVDAVSGDVTNAAAPLAFLDRLIDKDGHEYSTVGLRPLKCPNCAGDLPVRPRDTVFFCGTCTKAWYISGEELTQVPYSHMPPKPGQKNPLYFPFWVVEAKISTAEKSVETKFELAGISPGLRVPTEADKKVPVRFFVPAFEMASLSVFSRFAAAFTKNQPVWDDAGETGIAEKGCFLSPEDALEVAPEVLLSIIPKENRKIRQFVIDATVEPKKADLVLIPFFKAQYDFVDGLFGHSLPGAAVKE